MSPIKDMKTLASMDAQINELDTPMECLNPEMRALARRYGRHLPQIVYAHQWWVGKYVKAGGSFDSAGVWGFNPTSEEAWEQLTQLDPQKLGEWSAAIERWDSIYGTPDPEDYEALESQGVTPTNYPFWRVCVRKEELLKTFGLSWERSIWNLGRKSWGYIHEWIGDNTPESRLWDLLGSLYEEEDAYEVAYNALVKKHGEDAVYLVRALEERLRRAKKSAPSEYAVAYSTVVRFNPDGWEFLRGKTHEGTYLWEPYSENSLRTYTTVGLIQLFNGEYLLPDGRRTTRTRFKVGDTFFCFEPGTIVHGEGATLIEAANALARNMAGYLRQGEPVRFKDIAYGQGKLRAWCLAGTRRFLSEKAPHLGRMINGYSSWSEVPKDVMNIEWVITEDLFKDSPYNLFA